ncbi:hypothetical protein HBI52_223630 [Parastagonospora nodorum]|nr:hypothetical protein HBI52_223630 [Parastagonospora nodorum]KAH6111822.1 hypothetical protein HBI64_217320 [Parastagonospora nodorum]KAH6213607.1 hypothetical protein HBI53_107030 [Parastagonospora nodorum]KAH6538536.1 hypothetical protein HBI07_121860 [Parastagonospora nodorum]
MPNINLSRKDIAALIQGPPLVAVLIGATTGIGSYVARALANTFAKDGNKLRVYVVGRNASRAETLLTYGRQTSPGSDWRFVAVPDLTLMSHVDRFSQEVIKQEQASPFTGGPPRIDLLYMSQALSPMQESPATKEGLDSQMSLLFYSRMRFIQNLTPLLNASPKIAHVISIFAGGFEDAVKPDEIPIGIPSKKDYGVSSVRKHVAFMKTFAFEHLAEQHAGKISFIHIYPGLVDGPVFYSDVNPTWFKILWRLLKPLASFYMTSPEVCGEVMLSLATSRYPAKGEMKSRDVAGGVAYSTQRELAGGAYGVGMRGDEGKDVSYAKVRKNDTAQKVWEHLMEVFEGIEKKNATL